MKKYIKYTLKHYLPLFIVSFVMMLSIFTSVFSNIDATRTVMTEAGTGDFIGYDYAYMSTGGALVLAIPYMILTTIIPLFANSYKYKLRSVDLFYQTKRGEKSIRFANNLILFIMITALFLLAAISGICIAFAHQLVELSFVQTMSTSVYDGVRYEAQHYLFNFQYYIPVLFFIIVIGINNFFISYFLVTRSNNFLNSLITLIAGQLILHLGFMVPLWYIGPLVGNIDAAGNTLLTNSIKVLSVTRSSGFVSQLALLENVFNPLIVQGNNQAIIEFFDTFDPNSIDLYSLALCDIALVSYYAFGALACIKFFKEKEPSGELAGKPQGRDNYQIIIFNGIFIIMGTISSIGSLLLGTLLDFVSLMTSTVMFGAIYYALLGLLRRNFKLDKKGIVFFVLLVVVKFILSTIYFFYTLA